VKATVKELIQETPSVVVVRLIIEQPLDHKPGQFVGVQIEIDGKILRKPYSIASSPNTKDHIDLCIKVVKGGQVSTSMANLKPGDELEVNGPWGHFMLQEEINNDLIFIATGTGISALKPMIEIALQKSSHDIWLFFWGKNRARHNLQ